MFKLHTFLLARSWQDILNMPEGDRSNSSLLQCLNSNKNITGRNRIYGFLYALIVVHFGVLLEYLF